MTATHHEACTPIGEVAWRDEVRVRGRVRSVRVQPWLGAPSLEVTLYDETGGIVLVFTGRRAIAGVTLGRDLEAWGRSNRHRGYLSIVNPHYRLLG
jgi:RecG-like helicase